MSSTSTGGSMSEGERSRTGSAMSGTTLTTVREKYSQCVVTPSTTSFAIHTDGQLYVLDQASNDMVRQQMSNEAFRASMSDGGSGPKFMTVTVVGTPSGDRLSITSVRK
jgi:hypothetical protein